MQSFGILDNDLCDLSELCWTLGCKILLYMCMCVCMCMWCACVCACVCDVYVCVCACMCVYVCVHMCACVMHATVVKSNLINALGWNTTNFLLLPDWLHIPTSKIPVVTMYHRDTLHTKLSEKSLSTSHQKFFWLLCVHQFWKMVTIMIDTLLTCSTYTSPLYAAVARASFTHKLSNLLEKSLSASQKFFSLLCVHHFFLWLL